MNKKQKRFKALDIRKKVNKDLFHAKYHYKKLQRKYSKLKQEINLLKKQPSHDKDYKEISGKQDQLLILQQIYYNQNSEITKLKNKLTLLNIKIQNYKKD